MLGLLFWGEEAPTTRTPTMYPGVSSVQLILVPILINFVQSQNKYSDLHALCSHQQAACG